MAKRRLTRAERQQETREALLRSAAKIFAQRGFHAASVDEIAEAAGYSVGALYSNFANKEDLLHATAERYVSDQVERWAASFNDAQTLEGEIRAPADAHISSVTEDPEQFLLFIELWAHAVRNPQMRPRFAAGWNASKEFFVKAARQTAADAGLQLSDARADDLAAVLDALGLGLAMRKLVDPDTVPDDLFARLLGDLIPALFSTWQAEATTANKASTRRRTSVARSR